MTWSSNASPICDSSLARRRIAPFTTWFSQEPWRSGRTSGSTCGGAAATMSGFRVFLHTSLGVAGQRHTSLPGRWWQSAMSAACKEGLTSTSGRWCLGSQSLRTWTWSSGISIALLKTMKRFRCSLFRQCGAAEGHWRAEDAVGSGARLGGRTGTRKRRWSS